MRLVHVNISLFLYFIPNLLMASQLTSYILFIRFTNL